MKEGDQHFSENRLDNKSFHQVRTVCHEQLVPRPLIFTTLRSRHRYYSHFADKEIEAPKG